MSAGDIDYGELMQGALKGVMQRALRVAAEQGLPGRHHFYITFRTVHPGVRIANHLKAQYAEEMTVVLQHQFDSLDTDDDGFAVTLRFNRKAERLVIPFDAVTAFVDPAVNFALHFQAQDGEGAPMPAGMPGGRVETGQPAATAGDDEPGPDDDGDGGAPGGTVVSVDSFRNKK